MSVNKKRHWSLTAAAMLLLISACASATDPSPGGAAPTASAGSEAGTGFLDMGDRAGSTLAGRFTGSPVPLTGRVAARRDGCVTVMVDGVERVPLWPAGTTVARNGTGEDNYVVRLPGGVTALDRSSK